MSELCQIPRETPVNTVITGTLRCTSLLREAVDEQCVGACRCAFLSATGINFQSTCPSGCVCQAVRAPGWKARHPGRARTRLGSEHRIEADLPVNQSPGPSADGIEPPRVIFRHRHATRSGSSDNFIRPSRLRYSGSCAASLFGVRAPRHDPTYNVPTSPNEHARRPPDWTVRDPLPWPASSVGALT